MWLVTINLNSKKVNTLKVGHNVFLWSWPIPFNVNYIPSLIRFLTLEPFTDFSRRGREHDTLLTGTVYGEDGLKYGNNLR